LELSNNLAPKTQKIESLAGFFKPANASRIRYGFARFLV